MKGVSFLTDETHHKRYVQIDLDEFSSISNSGFEELIDIIIAAARKNDEKITLEELGDQLSIKM